MRFEQELAELLVKRLSGVSCRWCWRGIRVATSMGLPVRTGLHGLTNSERRKSPRSCRRPITILWVLSARSLALMLHLYFVLLRRRPRLLHNYQSDSPERELRGGLLLDDIDGKGKRARVVSNVAPSVHDRHIVFRFTWDLGPLGNCLDEKRICRPELIPSGCRGSSAACAPAYSNSTTY